jgi:hypothetical protein
MEDILTKPAENQQAGSQDQQVTDRYQYGKGGRPLTGEISGHIDRGQIAEREIAKYRFGALIWNQLSRHRIQ